MGARARTAAFAAAAASATCCRLVAARAGAFAAFCFFMICTLVSALVRPACRRLLPLNTHTYEDTRTLRGCMHPPALPSSCLRALSRTRPRNRAPHARGFVARCTRVRPEGRAAEQAPAPARLNEPRHARQSHWFFVIILFFVVCQFCSMW